MVKQIQKSEQQVLVNQKTIMEGKSLKQARLEIKRDLDFINNQKKNQKKIIRNREKELKELEKKSQRLNEEFKKKFEKLKKQEEKRKEKLKKPMITRYASTYHLNRILNYLGEFGETNITRIKEDCGMDFPWIKNALSFLIKHNFVTVEAKEGVKFYRRKNIPPI